MKLMIRDVRTIAPAGPVVVSAIIRIRNGIEVSAELLAPGSMERERVYATCSVKLFLNPRIHAHSAARCSVSFRRFRKA